VFGTLVGAGGGFILVPILLLMYPDREPETIASIGLFVVFANAVSGSIAYGRQGRVDYRSAGWFAAGTFPGAIAGALVVGFMPRRLFDLLFGVLLAAVGLFLVLRRMDTAIREPLTGRGVVRRELRDREGVTYFYAFHLWKGVAASAVIGFLSSLLGIGGGVIHVPVMATVLHFPIHIATATSQFVLAFMAGEGTAVHFATGALGFDRSLGQALYLSAGAVVGAQVGARLARRVRGPVIMRVLAIALVAVGARLIAKAWGV
jgi:uncharacterized membrane protein YfcA